MQAKKVALKENLLLKIAKDKKLSWQDKSVLLYVLGYCAERGKCDLSQRAMAEEISIYQPDISRSLNTITELGYVSKETAGRKNIYTTSLNVAPLNSITAMAS